RRHARRGSAKSIPIMLSKRRYQSVRCRLYGFVVLIHILLRWWLQIIPIYAGKRRPRVSSLSGTRRSPITKARAVDATGIPIEPTWRTPAPTRNVIPAPQKRAKEVANAKALARHSVGYCSGSHSVYTEKLAPPKPRKNSHTK